MKKLILILMLAGCAATPSAQLSKDAKGTVAELRALLPAECITPAVETTLTRLKSQIEQIPATCKVERQQMRKNAFMFIAGILATVAALLVGVILFKKYI